MDRKKLGLAIAAGIILIILCGIVVTLIVSMSHGTQPASTAAQGARAGDAAAAPAPIAISPAATGPFNITVESDFECGVSLESAVISDSHVVITLHDPINSRSWWMFRLTGVAGKKVQVDLKVPRAIVKWTTLNPVYSEVDDLDDAASYVAEKSSDSSMSSQGVTLPSTDKQKWHYISEALLPDYLENTFEFTQEFKSDKVWIANRVPYPPRYNEKFIAGLANNPLVKVHDLGTTPDGHLVRIVQIDSGDDEAARKKPCVVISSSDQADEPDGMWPAQGAILFLIGDSDRAKQLRQQCRFLIIPMLDPDGTARSNENFVGVFNPRSGNPTAVAYANFFQKWVLAGNRLDMVFMFYGLESNESPHILCAQLDGEDDRHMFAESVQKLVMAKFSDANMITSNDVWYPKRPRTRFGGWLSINYGAFDFSFELNPQDPTRHLDLTELKDMGRLFVDAAGDFFKDDYGVQMLRFVDDCRAQHAERWNGCPATRPSQNALESEDACLTAAASKAKDAAPEDAN